MYGVDYKLVELRRKFRAFYEQKLCGDYADLEGKRQEYFAKFLRRVLFWCVLTGGIVFYCHSRGISWRLLSNDGIAFLAVVYFVIMYVSITSPVDDYKEDTKKLVMTKILSFWGSFKYSYQRNGITEAVLKRSQLFWGFDKYEIDDCFYGSYNDTAIKVAEQKLTRRVRTRRGSYDETVFKGILILLQFDKDFCGQTIVQAKRLFRRSGLVYLPMVIGIIGLIIAIMIPFLCGASGFMKGAIIPVVLVVVVFVAMILNGNINKPAGSERVLLEDVVFSKKWNVYADDQIEARYILTPAFMERMLQVKQLFRGKDIEFSFFDNELLIAVHVSKDMFETTSLFCSALDYHKVLEVISQLYSVFSVVDVLKLGRNG